MSVADLYRNRGVNPLAVQGGSLPLPLDASTVGLWLFTEGAGTLTIDGALRTRNGTLSSAAMWGTGGPFNRVVTFNGSNQKIVPSSSWWQAPPWSIEIVGYFLFDASSGYLMDANNQPAIIYGFVNGSVSNAVECFAASYTGDNPRTGSQIAIPSAGWYYIAYCYSAGSWRGYRNGTEIFSLTKTFTLTGMSPYAFGAAGASSNFWNGKLAEIRISSTARSAAAILANAKLMGFA